MRLLQTSASPPIIFINNIVDATEEFVDIFPWKNSNGPPSIGIDTSEQGVFGCSSSEISFILISWHSMHENTIVHVHILQKAILFNHMLFLPSESPNHKTLDWKFWLDCQQSVSFQFQWKIHHHRLQPEALISPWKQLF